MEDMNSSSIRCVFLEAFLKLLLKRPMVQYGPMALLIQSLLKVLSTFVTEQSILAKVPDSATLQSEAAPQPSAAQVTVSQCFSVHSSTL